MRLLILILCLIPLTATAQNRADSARHQALPHNQQTKPQTQQQWPQNQPRTQLFCDQYARAAAGKGGTTRGSIAGHTIGKQGGAIATQDRDQAAALGIVGGAIGSTAGAQQDKQFYAFHFNECMSGGRLLPTSN
ncbi:hypothetical protein [Shimia abyssi]|nr:hypothetical protein [Shimia abyssi]